MWEYSGSVAPAMATSFAEMAMEADAEAMRADSLPGALWAAVMRRRRMRWISREDG